MTQYFHTKSFFFFYSFYTFYYEILRERIIIFLLISPEVSNYLNLIKQDTEELEIVIIDEKIQSVTKVEWKKYINEQVENLAFKSFREGNRQKSKTKHTYILEGCSLVIE